MRTLQIATHLTIASMAVLLTMPTTVALADQPAITSGQAEEILSELRRIRQLLENGAPVPVQGAAAAAQNAVEKVSVTTRDSNTLGSADAPLTLIEFADYQCPFCQKFETTVFDELKRNFVDTGKLRYVARDLPLPMHEHATEAARAARCAGERGRYWEARHLLMMNQQKLGRDDLIGYAHDLHLDIEVFTHCLDDRKYETAVQQDAADAAEVGVIGTPTFVLGRTQQKGRFTGIKIVGAQPYGVYEAKIRVMLGNDPPIDGVAKAEPVPKAAAVDVTSGAAAK
jgi:protein-disulfide isomerase